MVDDLELGAPVSWRFALPKGRSALRIERVGEQLLSFEAGQVQVPAAEHRRGEPRRERARPALALARRHASRVAASRGDPGPVGAAKARPSGLFGGCRRGTPAAEKESEGDEREGADGSKHARSRGREKAFRRAESTGTRRERRRARVPQKKDVRPRTRAASQGVTANSAPRPVRLAHLFVMSRLSVGLLALILGLLSACRAPVSGEELSVNWGTLRRDRHRTAVRLRRRVPRPSRLEGPAPDRRCQQARRRERVLLRRSPL